MQTTRVALLAVLGGALAAALPAPGASAATQRYASPTGSGTTCDSASPCGIRHAVAGAVTGDEVIVSPGDYPLTETLTADPSKQITIHGVAGAPRPRLLFSGAGQRGVDLDSLSAASGSTLRYVEVVQTAQERAIFAGRGATIDQVIARTSANAGVVTATVRNGTVSNSILVASGANAIALETGASGGELVTSAARNVTAIATGTGGLPIHVMAATSAGATLHLVNVIAHAGPGAIGLKAVTDSAAAVAVITASYTSYQGHLEVGSQAKLLTGSGNRADEPAFVNAAAGDYRQAPGASTIDAGIDYGGFDVDGDARSIGKTDIGADEFVPAPVVTTGAGGSDPTSTTAPARPFAGVELVSSRLTLARRVVTVMLRCPAGTVGRCTGRTRLTARRTSSSRITLGRASFSIAAGQQGRARVRVSRAGRRLLRRADGLRGRVRNAAHDAAGQTRTTAAAVTIRHRRR